MDEVPYNELIAVDAEDQSFRDELARDGSVFEGYHSRMEEMHRHHAARLKQIIEQHGWPGRREVAFARIQLFEQTESELRTGKRSSRIGVALGPGSRCVFHEPREKGGRGDPPVLILSFSSRNMRQRFLCSSIQGPL